MRIGFGSSLSSLLKASAFAGALAAGILASGSASAGLVNVDGINTQQATDGSTNIISQFDRDTLVIRTGDTLRGVGLVTQIQNTNAGPTYIAPCLAVGCAGTFLSAYFDNFVLRDAIYNGSTGTDLFFTGGFLKYYVLNARPNQNAGNVALDIANSTSATLWLSLVPQVFDADGDTFHVFVPGTIGGLGTFQGNAQGDAILDVVGGDAAALWDNNGYLNPFSNTLADLAFSGNATRLQRPGNPLLCPTNQDFCVSGDDTLNDILPTRVSEPGSMLLFATGILSLLGAGLRRRRART